MFVRALFLKHLGSQPDHMIASYSQDATGYPLDLVKGPLHAKEGASIYLFRIRPVQTMANKHT